MVDTSLSEGIRRWGLKGGMAILDQGIFSGSNFVLNIVLARWLLPNEYGAYAICFTVSVLFLQLLISYILEPMGILGPALYGGDLPTYLRAQVRIYFLFTIALGLIFALGARLYGHLSSDPLLSSVLVALGMLLSLILLPWMLRRVFYILGRPASSVTGSIVYAISLLAVVFIFKRIFALSALSSVYSVAIAGLISGIFLLFQLEGWRPVPSAFSVRRINRGNWEMGRWLVVSSILMVIAAQAQIYIAGSVLGLTASGIIYALQTLSQPMTLTVTAISALVTPNLASDYARRDFPSFKRKAFGMTLVLTGLAILFEVLLILFNGPIELIIYGGRFSEQSMLIPVWGLTPLITSLVSGVQSGLQAAKYSQSSLIASVVWLPVSLVSCLIFIQLWGLWGVAWSTVLGYIALGCVSALLFWYWVHKPSVLIHR